MAFLLNRYSPANDREFELGMTLPLVAKKKFTDTVVIVLNDVIT